MVSFHVVGDFVASGAQRRHRLVRRKSAEEEEEEEETNVRLAELIRLTLASVNMARRLVRVQDS